MLHDVLTNYRRLPETRQEELLKALIEGKSNDLLKPTRRSNPYAVVPLIREATSHSLIPLNSPDYLEIIFVLEGAASCTIGEEDFPIQRGDLFFVNGSDPYTIRVQKDSSITYLHLAFQPSVLRPSRRFDTLARETAAGVLDGEIQFSLIEPIFRTDDGFSLRLTITDEAFYRLLHLGLLVVDSFASSSNQEQTELILRAFLKAVYRESEEKIRERFEVYERRQSLFLRLFSEAAHTLTRKLCLSDVVEAVNVANSKYENAFQEVLGETLQDFMNRRRMEIARKLVAGTTMAVDAVATETGFTSTETFTDAFRKHTGKTPQELRNSAA